MEPATVNASPDLATFIRTFQGKVFEGYAVLFEGRFKTSHFYASTGLGLMCDKVSILREIADVYICIGTQEEDLGPKRRGGVKSVVTVGGFFADLDFASSKDSARAYPPDEVTVLSILKEFKLPPTAIVRTGNGLHVHWAFQEPVTLRNRSQRAAHQACHRAFHRMLSELFARHGYEIDNVSDLARVYRAPGTFNHKSTPPKPVELLEFHPEVRVPAELVVSTSSAPRRGGPGKGRRQGPLAHHEILRQGCAWYRHVTGEGARDCPEPDWYAAASITCRTDDGGATFQAYSSLHPGYDEREADTKFRRSIEEAGPRTCQAIRDGGNERVHSFAHYVLLASVEDGAGGAGLKDAGCQPESQRTCAASSPPPCLSPAASWAISRSRSLHRGAAHAATESVLS